MKLTATIMRSVEAGTQTELRDIERARQRHSRGWTRAQG
jgi:hypothetical protein